MDFKTYTYSCDEETDAKLRELAAADERPISAMIRWLINREFERRFPAPAPAPSNNGGERAQ